MNSMFVERGFYQNNNQHLLEVDHP
jgi:hypothetical protein